MATGVGPRSVVVDPSSRFAYVANTNSSTLSAYTIDTTTGQLTSVGPALPTGASPVDVAIDASTAKGLIVGAPKLTFTYTGTSPPGEQPTRVFAQLVDDTNGLVLGNQITPIQVTLDGQPHDASTSLEIVSFAPQPGSHLTLQLVATTVAYATPRLGGSIRFTTIHVELPVATNLTP